MESIKYWFKDKILLGAINKHTVIPCVIRTNILFDFLVFCL